MKISRQKNNETLISRNIEKILDLYIKDHFSKDVIDFVEKNNIDSKSGTLQDALKEYAIKDPNGYYHYYKDGLPDLTCTQKEVDDFINSLNDNETAFVMFKLDGEGYIYWVPYDGNAHDSGQRQYIHDNIKSSIDLNVLKKEIEDFREMKYGDKHDFREISPKNESPIRHDNDLSVKEAVEMESRELSHEMDI